VNATAPDPLARIRNELVAAAARANRRRIRRRRVLALVVLPAVLIVASAGAAAVGDFPTGVGVIDRLLETEGQGNDGIDRQPGPLNTSEPIRLPNAPDGAGATAIAYLSRDGRVCQAEADVRRRDGAARGTSGGPCFEPDTLARILTKKRATLVGSSHGADFRIYEGFAAGDVVAVRFHMEDGATVDAKLTPPWTPDAHGAEPLRLFVAIDERDIDVGEDGVQIGESELLHPRYRVEAELRDGTTVPIQAPGM
jgi:hypothetical protein